MDFVAVTHFFFHSHQIFLFVTQHDILSHTNRTVNNNSFSLQQFLFYQQTKTKRLLQLQHTRNAEYMYSCSKIWARIFKQNTLVGLLFRRLGDVWLTLICRVIFQFIAPAHEVRQLKIYIHNNKYSQTKTKQQ